MNGKCEHNVSYDSNEKDFYCTKCGKRANGLKPFIVKSQKG